MVCPHKTFKTISALLANNIHTTIKPDEVKKIEAEGTTIRIQKILYFAQVHKRY